MHPVQSGSAMVDIRSIVARFPQRELDIRRCCLRDPDFKSICEDYEEAAIALHHWQKVAKEEGDPRVEEYTDLLGELEAEILTKLDS
jgi:hypothetical protein